MFNVLPAPITCCMSVTPENTGTMCLARVLAPNELYTLSAFIVPYPPSVDAGTTGFLNTLGRCRAPKHIHNNAQLARWRAPKVFCATSAGPEEHFPQCKRQVHATFTPHRTDYFWYNH